MSIYQMIGYDIKNLVKALNFLCKADNHMVGVGKIEKKYRTKN